MDGYGNEDDTTEKIPQLMELVQYMRLRLANTRWHRANLCAFISPDNTSQYELKYALDAVNPSKRIRLSEHEQEKVENLFIEIRNYFIKSQLPIWNKARITCCAEDEVFNFDYYFDSLYAWLEQLDKSSAAYNKIPVDIELRIQSFTGLSTSLTKETHINTLLAIH